jgi:hypothetical protein
MGDFQLKIISLPEFLPATGADTGRDFLPVPKDCKPFRGYSSDGVAIGKNPKFLSFPP